MSEKGGEKQAKARYENLQIQANRIAQEVAQPLQVISMVLEQCRQGVIKKENLQRGQRMVEKIVDLAEELKGLIAGGEELSGSADKIIVPEEEKSKIDLKGKILVVDDNIDILDMMVENLKMVGYECNGVLNGEKALELLNKESYDLVISDLLMPVMSGKELFEEISQKEKEMKFLFLTGYALTSDLQDVVKQAEGILYKPFQLDQLFKEVGRILSC